MQLPEFEKYLDEHSQNYQFLFYDNTTNSRNNRLQIIKAEQVQFKLKMNHIEFLKKSKKNKEEDKNVST